MARVKIPITVLGIDGRPFSGAAVTIRRRADNSTATVYAGETGGATLSNPLATGDSAPPGMLAGWVERDAYAAVVAAGAGVAAATFQFDAAAAADGAVAAPWLTTTVGDRLSALEVPEIVGALPASPANGKRVLLAAGGMHWPLVWVQSLSQWLPVGRCPPLFAARTSVGSASVTVPAAGSYDVQLSLRAASSAGTAVNPVVAQANLVQGATTVAASELTAIYTDAVNPVNSGKPVYARASLTSGVVSLQLSWPTSGFGASIAGEACIHPNYLTGP